MSEQRCYTCRWWGDEPYTHRERERRPSGVESHYVTHDDIRECCAASECVDEAPPDAPVFALTCCDGATVMTRGDFACTLWEPHDTEETA